MKLLSIIVPVYNEKDTILKVLDSLDSIDYVDKEIIISDDGSTDGTQDILFGLIDKPYRIILNNENKGKGNAIQLALEFVKGDYVLIQDADLEYHVPDIKKLVELANQGAVAVYGTRFHKDAKHKKGIYYYGNRLVTLATKIICMSTITDMETGYKLIDSSVLKFLELKEEGFGFEPEVTAKLLKYSYKIKEVPILYHPRTFKQGKKINWKDGVKAIWLLFKYYNW